MTVVGLFSYQQSFFKPHRASASIPLRISHWSKPSHQARACEPPDVISNLISKLLVIFVSYKTYSVKLCNVVRSREQQTGNGMKQGKRVDLLFAALEIKHKKNVIPSPSPHASLLWELHAGKEGYLSTSLNIFWRKAETKCSLLGQEISSSSSETAKGLNAPGTLECLIFD